jgi:hypothetical protein
MNVLPTIEKFFWGMVWLVLMLIIAFWLLGLGQNAGGTSIVGRFFQWVNDRARPQAS